jgi:hypothetical protein
VTAICGYSVIRRSSSTDVHVFTVHTIHVMIEFLANCKSTTELFFFVLFSFASTEGSQQLVSACPQVSYELKTTDLA